MNKTKPKGLIKISNLKTSCIIGVKPEERLAPQELLIDIVLAADLSKAVSSDDIKDTVDYDNLAAAVVDFVAKSNFQLIEKLAFQTATLIKELSDATQVKVVIKKPVALEAARYASVEVSIS